MRARDWFGKTAVLDRWFLSFNEGGRGLIFVADLRHMFFMDVAYWTPRFCPRLFVYITRGVFRIEPSLLPH